ncbi:MAG TPA: NADPH:quinone oxidoreductase family protein [Vicinamibacterales bacterium]|nr:NADPH:quinone oxidoreductase family protein [Vicinamibacterales bacterium]
MKAVLCRAYGPPASLVIDDVPSPLPGLGEVRVAVRAASVNFPDLLIIENKYQVKPPLPFSPGCEAAGVIAAVGDGVADIAPGDRVMAITGYGAFAGEICVPADRVFQVPDSMDDETAASFLFTYATAHHALRDRGELQRGETLLVLGAAGGVGTAALEVGNAVGARVIACASTDEKLAFCRAHGASETINYATSNLRDELRRLVGENGVDVVCDPVGGAYTEAALRSMAWRGRLLVVGFTAGEIPKIPLNLPLLKGCSIIGVSWGGHMRREPEPFARGVDELVRWYCEGRLRPHVDRTFPLERVADAMNQVANRAVMGKVVIKMQ